MARCPDKCSLRSNGATPLPTRDDAPAHALNHFQPRTHAMNLNLALTVLLPALVGGTLAVVTATDLAVIHDEAKGKAAAVQAQHDAQTLEAARILFELNTGRAPADEQELVARGYLKESWLTRERVDTTPLTLPAAE